MTLGHYPVAALHARGSRGKAPLAPDAPPAEKSDTLPVEKPEERDGDLSTGPARRREHPDKMAEPGSVRGYVTK